MIKVDNIEVFNFEGALRGMRNPKQSWSKSDSGWEPDVTPDYIIGPNDLKLAQKLVLAGTEHAKFMRQIFVSMDITAPLYVWKEMDTYKVATTANSTSTMHTISKRYLTREDFSFEGLDDLPLVDPGYSVDFVVNQAIDSFNQMISQYKVLDDKRYWEALIKLLPEGFNQTRTWTADYQTLRNIYFQRRNHKLSEWHTFCDIIEKLPYGKELICLEESI